MKVSFRFELACEVIQLIGVQVWHQEGAGSLFIDVCNLVVGVVELCECFVRSFCSSPLVSLRGRTFFANVGTKQIFLSPEKCLSLFSGAFLRPSPPCNKQD